MADEVHLGGAGRGEHLRHEGGQLARGGGDVTGIFEISAATVVEGEDAVAVIGQEWRGRLPVLVLIRERPVYEDDRVRMSRCRGAAGIVSSWRGGSRIVVGGGGGGGIVPVDRELGLGVGLWLGLRGQQGSHRDEGDGCGQPLTERCSHT